jgi:hypothetical protein
MSKQHRPSTDTRAIASLIQAPVYGFDRLSAYVDHPKPSVSSKRIRNLCKDLKIIENQCLPFQNLWQSHISIQQPSSKAICLLAEALRKENNRSRPFYGEIAVDFITETISDARLLGHYFLERMLVKHCRDGVIRERECTFYFHQRADFGGNKRTHVTVLYWDKPSGLAGKFQGRPCCHIEHRYSGSAALGNLGINCMADFALFSHQKFWHNTMKLAELPSKTEIGRTLVSGKAACSDTALWKRGDQFLKDFHLGDALVLQNICLKCPEMRRLLRSIPNNIILDTKN